MFKNGLFFNVEIFFSQNVFIQHIFPKMKCCWHKNKVILNKIKKTNSNSLQNNNSDVCGKISAIFSRNVVQSSPASSQFGACGLTDQFFCWVFFFWGGGLSFPLFDLLHYQRESSRQ